MNPVGGETFERARSIWADFDVKRAWLFGGRARGEVTAGMSDAEFEAWLVAQGAVRMSEERHAALRPALPGVGS